MSASRFSDFFTMYYLLFRTESEIFFASRAADPEERPEWPPSIYSILFPMENLPKPRCFASRATNPECRPADLLFFTIYYLLFTIYYLLFTIYYLLLTTYYLLFTTYYLLFTIYYLLFTIYYLLFTIYYLLFTIYYLLFKTESENSLHRGQPTQRNGQNGPLLFTLYYSRPEWPPSIYSVLVPMENFAKPGFFASRATNPECRPADLLFFTIYYFLFRTESEIFFASRAADPEERPEWPPSVYSVLFPMENLPKPSFLHRGPPTLNVGQQIYYFLLFTIYYLLFTIYYLLFTIYYLLFTIYYLLFTIYYLLFRTESENSLHRGQPTQKNGQNGPLLFTLYYSRPEWPPSIYSVLFPMENFAKPGFFASRAPNPECRPADLLFF